MNSELYPTITLRARSFNILQAPKDTFIKALNRNLNLKRFKILYVTGNYSAILSKLDRWTAASRPWRSAEALPASRS